MLMQHPNKGRVTTIIASIKKQKGMGQSEDGGQEQYREQKGPSSENGRAKEGAMEGFLSASQKNDPRGMVRALQTFFDLCYADSEASEDEGPSYDEESEY